LPLSSTTTTTITTTSTQQGKKLVVTGNNNVQTVGNFVTDITIQPYIAPRTIGFTGVNLRPRHRVHIFFDSVLVDQYCAPGFKNASDTSDSNSIIRSGNWGDPIYTDDKGSVAGVFAIPQGTFKTGERVLQISDVTSLAQGNDAMSMIASATFTASNISVTKDLVTLTTVNPEVAWVDVSNTIITTQVFSNTVITPDIYNISYYYYEPVAQAMTINVPNKEAGVFATSIDLYFKQKSSIGNGVLLYICEMVNGYPNGKSILPFSAVHLDSDDILVSEDASIKTTFTFESPVFLSADTEYAFIVKPDQNDPDVWLWTAELGDIDVTTGVQVSSQPIVGTAYYGATVSTWTVLPKEYIKFNLNVASFNQSQGEIYFTNKTMDYITIFNLSYVNTNIGIVPGDVVFQAANATINATGGSCNTAVFGIVEQFDPGKGLLYLSPTTGGFVPNTFCQVHRFGNNSVLTPNATTLVLSANTYRIYNPIINSLVPQYAFITPAGTSLDFKYQGYGNNFVKDTNEIQIGAGTENEFFDRTRYVFSKTNEDASLAGDKSLNIHVTMKTDSPLVSPVIDTVKFNNLTVRNLIDPISSDYLEFFSTGIGRAKYVSKIVTLAEGQDAEDIQVVVSAHRPPSSQIQVWAKFLNAEDPETINQKTWTPLRPLNADVFSDPTNTSDFQEFSFAIPYTYPLISTSGTITANDSTTSVVGTNTVFGNTSTDGEVYQNWQISVVSNSTFVHSTRKIVSVTDNTHLTIDKPFAANVTGAQYFIVPPPTTAWLSQNTVVKMSGNVAVNNATNMITGTGTNFKTEFQAGDIVSIGGNSTITIPRDSQIVTSVINATAMTVGAPWSFSVSSANVYLSSSDGLTYLNNDGARFTSFKQFQFKIILQSDDSARVPLLDDLRVLCLQL